MRRLGLLLAVAMVFSAGCGMKAGGGGMAISDGGIPHPESIVITAASDLKKAGFTVTVNTNDSNGPLRFYGNSVTGTFSATASGADWTLRQYRWRPGGASEYERARIIIENSMK